MIDIDGGGILIIFVVFQIHKKYKSLEILDVRCDDHFSLKKGKWDSCWYVRTYVSCI